MTDSPVVALGDIADSVDYGITASALQHPDGPKFLRITDIQHGCVNWDTVPWCRSDSRGISEALLRPGDIVFARTGATTGKSFLISDCPVDAVFASYLIRLRVGASTDPSYLSHYFRTPEYWDQISKTARGVAQPGVNATALRALLIPRPPLSKQRRIAEVLDRAETLRAKRRAALAQLDTLGEAIFIDIFGDPVTNRKGWPETATLGEMSDVVSGVTKGRNLSDRSCREVSYLAVANVQDMALDLSTVKKIMATEHEITRYRLQRGDLLLTEGGDPDKLGRGTLWNEELDECIHQNHIFRVRLKTDTLTPTFLNWLIASQRGKRYFLRSAKQTTGIASINTTQLRGFPLLIPPLHGQREFTRRVGSVDKLKAVHRASLAELDALFASLQHRAFRGEL